MKFGIPKGLLFCKYKFFLEKFISEIGAEYIESENTNKNILNLGAKYCVDEACLPIKIFHGHVASLRDKCDVVIVPRIMQIRDRQFICPKFCGLTEMVKHSIPNIKVVGYTPLYISELSTIFKFCNEIGGLVINDKKKIMDALFKSIENQKKSKIGINNNNFNIKVALIGHPYNVYDEFINMNLVSKLNKLGVGIITEENLNQRYINKEVRKLYKRPFWHFAHNAYGFSVYEALNKKVDGIIYISSFACGIDSVVIELIKDRLQKFPILILKIDEQTGEAGLDTRIEAFADMLKRRNGCENNISTYGEHISCS